MKQETKYLLDTIGYFRTKYLPEKVEINYSSEEDNKKIKLKIPKEHFNSMSALLEQDELDFEVIPMERKIEMKYPRFNGKKLLKTKHFKMDIYFVDPTALKTVENIKNKEELHIKTWSDFFETIDPEYRNIMKKIIDGISIAVFKNEYNKIISKKSYYLDFKDGLYEKKEKFINQEWVITYQPVTSNIQQVFRMFFKFFEEVPLNELADFSKFKDIISKTKFKTFI